MELVGMCTVCVHYIYKYSFNFIFCLYETEHWSDLNLAFLESISYLYVVDINLISVKCRYLNNCFQWKTSVV